VSVDPVDPVRQRRELVGRFAAMARLAGWSLFGLAFVAFIVGMLTGLDGFVVVIVIGAIALGSTLLLPAIIIGFGVTAAEREDRG
jgi:hypothetical protein